MSNKEYFITTKDNPYNYFTEFEEWLAFDKANGYNTLEFLGRLVKTSEGNSDSDNDLEIQRAIDEMIHYNVLGLYTKVYNNEPNKS